VPGNTLIAKKIERHACAIEVALRLPPGGNFPCTAATIDAKVPQ